MFTQIILTIIICVLFINWLKKGKLNLPPGPVQLPILGSVIQLHRANPHYAHVALAKLAQKYGDIMSFGFGMHVFQRVDTNSNRFEFPYVSDRNYGKNLGILWSHGDTWVDIRAFTKKTLKEFGYGKVKIMDKSLNDSAHQLIDDIKIELLDSTDGTFAVETHKFSIHVINVLWNSVGGYKFDPNDELLKKNIACADKAIEIIIEILCNVSDDVLESGVLKKIPYVKATMLEILRMGNVVPMPLPRCATKDINLISYKIQKGTILFYNLYAMYNDKKYWTDPENFRPERFLHENTVDGLQSERILNTIFGTGPRVCFGEAVATDTLFVFLAALAVNFKFDAILGQEPSTENPHVGICVCPRKYSVKVTPQLR